MKKLILSAALLALTLPAVARPRSVELVGIGDSVTRGYGSGNGLSYFDLITKDLKVTYPDLKVINKSKNGSTSKGHVEQVKSLPVAPPGTFGVVTVTSGGNDIMHNFGKTRPHDTALYGTTVAQGRPWFAAFRRRLRHILTAIPQRFPAGCDIYLCTVYDPTDGRGDLHNLDHVWPVWPEAEGVLAAYNKVIVECSHLPHVHLVDVHRAFLHHGEHSADFHKHGYFFDNQEDLNDRGQHALHDLMWRHISADLGGLPQSPDTRAFKDD